MRMVKFPSIEAFNTTVKNLRMHFQYAGKDEDGKAIYDSSRTLPALTFRGETKLHGTNGAVCFDTRTNEFYAQSRERILSMESDNAGFNFFVQANKTTFMNMITEYFKGDLPEGIISIYGEWAGPGIQKGVAISQIPLKSFFIFGLKVSTFPDGDDAEPTVYWLDHTAQTERIGGSEIILKNNLMSIYNMDQFQTWSIEVDLNRPELIVNELIQLTEHVEAECPVGRFFGISGTGEGIVWSTNLGQNDVIRFKVKGEKHSSSKVKTIAAVDVEKMNNIHEFAEYAVTENRLNQGIEQVFTQYNKVPTVEDTGLFVKWISSDVIKEEMQVMQESGLEPKVVMGAVSKKAAGWFKQYLMNT